MPPLIPIRFVRHIGTSFYMRIYWDEPFQCKDSWRYHEVRRLFDISDVKYDWQRHEDKGRLPPEDPMWPAVVCDRCGAIASAQAKNIHRMVFTTARYDTKESELQVGDMYYTEHEPGAEDCPGNWANCDGRHLNVICPPRWDWDVDSRASNCTMRDDQYHRCWVRHGDPEKNELHVDKAGRTCAAGAGSILVPGSNNTVRWHGFLHHNFLKTC